MKDRAQVSVEYLMIVGISVIIAALIAALSLNVLGIKDGIKELIVEYRTRVFSLK